MTTGFDLLDCLGKGEGKSLSDLAGELGVSHDEVRGWIDLLCSTGYLKRISEEKGGTCSCNCNKACSCCHAPPASTPSPGCGIELTQRGVAYIRRTAEGTG